ADQLTYIINHAEDKVIFVDRSLLPLLERHADELRKVEHFVVMGEEPGVPESAFGSVHEYEALLAAAEPSFAWPKLDENDACAMCSTSGTTGNPKGVLYSHRSTFLHSLEAAFTDGLGLSMRDTVLPVVPMFHVNAWGLPHASVLLGAKQVFPGPG